MTDIQTYSKGRFLELVSKDGWEYATRTNATGVVAIIALTKNDELVLVEQHRPPLSSNVIELPAGLVGDEPGSHGELVATAAQRELLEETGFAAQSMEFIATLASSAGLTDEVVAFYQARGITQVSAGGGVGNENITTHLVPRQTFHAWLIEKMQQGIQVDAKVMAGIALIQVEL